MKINSIKTNTGYLNSRAEMRSTEREKECVQKNLKQNSNEQINTTIKSNSDGRVSFKGGAPFLHKLANFASDKPLVAEALFAIFITCGARPLSIMATAKTDEEKEKCKYQVAKSISSGVVGLAMTSLVGLPIAAAAKKVAASGGFKMPEKLKQSALKKAQAGVDVLGGFVSKLMETGADTDLLNQTNKLIEGGKLNLYALGDAGKKGAKDFMKKIDKVAPEISKTVKTAIKAQTSIDNYSGTAKNIIDKFFQPIFMPLRATITIALVPPIINLLGIKKGCKPQQVQNQNPYSNLSYNVVPTKSEKDLFQSFAGVANHENK